MLGAPAGMVGVGSGFPPHDARCAVYAFTAVCLHSMGHGPVLDTLHRSATQGPLHKLEGLVSIVLRVACRCMG